MARALASARLDQGPMVVIAIGIIGATVMPHNLYLHSAVVQSRQLGDSPSEKRRAIWFNTIDTSLALAIAFLVNAGILVLAAIVFYGNTSVAVGDRIIEFGDETDWITDGYVTLAVLVGTSAASILFGVALLASGQSSTITGTLAGQIVMEGFMRWRIRPWLRRLITRSLAIVPTVLLAWLRPEVKPTNLLVLSQVVLAMQLPLAMLALLYVTSARRWMGEFRSGWFLLIAGWGSFAVITALDLYGLPDAIEEALEIVLGEL
jgi:manganese transport protein